MNDIIHKFADDICELLGVSKETPTDQIESQWDKTHRALKGRMWEIILTSQEEKKEETPPILCEDWEI